MKIFGLLPFLMNSAGVASPGGGGDSGGGALGGDYGSGGDSGGGELVPSGGGDVHDAEFVDDGQYQPQAITSKNERLVEKGKITAKAGRMAIDAVRAVNPAYAQRITQALMLEDAVRREFGSIKNIRDLKQKIADIGEDSGITELRQKADDLAEIDRLYDSADPQFIAGITSDEAGQESFLKLMPVAQNRWAQLDPAGHAWAMADHFSRGLDSVRMPVLAARVTDLLNNMGLSETDPLLNAWNAMVEALNSISYRAQANRPQTPQKDPKIESERQQLQRQQQELTRSQWTEASMIPRRRIWASTFMQLTKGRQVSEEQDAEIKAAYDIAIGLRERQYKSQVDTFLQRGDKEGFLKTDWAFYRKAIPDALNQAVRRVMGNAPGRKPATAPASPARQVQRSPIHSQEAGFIRVRTMPDNIDPNRTTADMLRRNQGVGRDGKKYAWAS